ncbi:MAG: Haloacid dehalogenase-like hydrolase, partial [Pseudomonadota bacterium]
MVSAGQFLDLGASARQAVAAVLFDLDGTLVDTMPIHYAAYRDVLAEFDIPLAFDDFIA